MVTLSPDSRPIIGRGPPLGASFFFLGVLAVAVMALDHRSGYLDGARQWLSAAANPLYAAVETPFNAWDAITESFRDRKLLREDNERLSSELQRARVQLLRLEALHEENRRLRQIREATQGFADATAERTLIAEIVRVHVDAFRHRMRINKGAADGVFEGQPVLDAFGVVGQVARVDKYSSQIILITDAAHAIPVLINRNGVRTIAAGLGDMRKMSLPFLTAEADVTVGDLLVSSGLDGVFPAGYPVARVSHIERDPVDTFALVEAQPLALLDREREVLLLWPSGQKDEVVEEEAAVSAPAVANKEAS